MQQKKMSIISSYKNKTVIETVAQAVFMACAFAAVFAVISISAYMIISGTPALFKIGIGEILFGEIWKPSAANPLA